MIGALVAGVTGSGGASLSSYESIATATGTGSSGTITFSSIPQTYTHLQIRCISKNTQAGTGNVQINLTLNGSTTGYAHHWIYGDGATVSVSGTASTTNIQLIAGECYSSSGYHSVGILDILDYASTTKNKTTRWFGGANGNETAGAFFFGISSGLWTNTNAITSISLTNSSASNFATTTQFALYGIKAA